MHVITFDFHNTIAHCEAWFRLEVQDLPGTVLREQGYPEETIEAATDLFQQLRRGVVASGNERTAVECCRSVFGQLDLRVEVDHLTAQIDAIMRASMHNLAPVEGAIATIRELHGAGYRLGVVSSAIHHDVVSWALASFGLVEAFDVIVTSARCGVYKSNPTIYRHALDLLDDLPERSIHVGDSLQWDAGTASQLGMSTVLLRTGCVDRFRSNAAPVEPDLVLDTLVDASGELEKLFRSLCA